MSNRVIDPRAAERRRSILLTIAAVVVLAVIAAIVIIMTTKDGQTTETGSDADLSKNGTEVPTVVTDGAIRITAAAQGTTPSVVITVTEDFQCPACHQFEQLMGPTLAGFHSNPAVAIDYVSINMLDRASTTAYSSRAANAAMCVAEKTGSGNEFGKWLEYHNLLFANQPPEGGSGLNNSVLIQLAKDAGVEGIDDCVTEISYRNWINENSQKIMALPDFKGTPSLRINGELVEITTANDLQDKVNAAVEAAR
ncbi:MAG: thioredoxin domain-containing protein [Gordonia sp. (in: high G+C Gram-positive bacteria)]|uniref:DsbA family protein n=1 Tax=Gordonia sp. (in: high G+C Gram-positive bacteria) TaxID=84139 RepID=UPI003BB685F4